MIAPPEQNERQPVPAGALEGVIESPTQRRTEDLPAFGTIGEDLSSHRLACDWMGRFAKESHDSDWQCGIDDAESNAIVYEEGYDPKPGDETVTSNEIQGLVISITDIQTREPKQIVIKPVETRGKAKVFWIGPPVTPEIAMATGLPIGLGMQQTPMLTPDGQPIMDPAGKPMMGIQPQTQYLPLDEWIAFQVRRLAQSGLFPTEWVCVLDDKLIADIYQTVFDVMWVDSEIDAWLYSNVLMTNIYGYQTAYYGWDSQMKRHLVENISIREVFLDRAKMEQSRMRRQMFEIVMDVDEAKAFYPQIAPLIEKFAESGQSQRVDSYSGFGIGNDRQWESRTVTIRTAFVSNQVMPMTRKEALERGFVFEMDGDLHLSDDGWKHSTGADAKGNLNPEDGSLPPGPWPTTRGIRQISTMNETGRVVEDMRCEHPFPPILLNVCIPLPGKPEGQGIPKKLKSMQAADIRLLTAMVRYAESFSNPGSMIPQSVADELSEGLSKTFIDPTEHLIAPDHLVERFGEKAVLWFRPPPMPDAVPATIELMRQKRNNSGGHPEVMQGVPPSSNASGKMVEALQAGVTSQFGFQAQWTRKMQVKLANLMHYSHLWRLELPDIAKIYSRLPMEILAMAIEQARSSRWDVYADVADGSVGMAGKKLNRAISLNAIKSGTGESAMSMTTLREEAGLDAEQESLRWKQEQGLAGTAPQPGGAAPGGEKKPTPEREQSPSK